MCPILYECNWILRNIIMKLDTYSSGQELGVTVYHICYRAVLVGVIR